MRTVLILFLQVLLSSPIAMGQRSYAGIGDYSHTVHYADRKVVFHLKEGGNGNVNADATKTYAWYSGNQINTTQGGFNGKLLDGEFTEYFLNKNLKSKGEFEEGLKVGLWRNWRENGQLESSVHFLKGVMAGRSQNHDEQGVLREEGKYDNGLKQGYWMRFISKDSITVQRYDKGVIVPERRSRALEWIGEKWKGIFGANKVKEPSTMPVMGREQGKTKAGDRRKGTEPNNVKH